jgi:catechol 2,3-dioxygenase-like lactoylglutathione lyase family enzyme
MSLLHVEGVTHWSIPVNNLEESEDFYGELLGLTPVGRLGTARIACFIAGGHHILLCERAATIDHTSLNLSYFVARKTWRRRDISPRRGRAHRQQRREPLRDLLVPMDTHT